MLLAKDSIPNSREVQFGERLHTSNRSKSIDSHSLVAGQLKVAMRESHCGTSSSGGPSTVASNTNSDQDECRAKLPTSKSVDPTKSAHFMIGNCVRLF